jgi:tetratricopeptide (TPR) repeat protein
LQSSEQFERCAKISEEAWPRHKDSASAMNIAAVGLDCAVSLEKETSGREALIAKLEKNANATMANPRVKVAADDRSGLYQVLIGAREDAGDKEGQRKITQEWASFLEREAEKAKNAEARAVFDSHRLTAYLALEQPERAVPMLEASERDLPKDYNPPARLAVAYRAMKQYDLALAASDRALPKAYGPRKVSILRTRSDIFLDKGDKEEAKKVAQEALQLAESLPAGQRSDRTIAAIKQKIESIQ